ncbi:hypothetical protein J437_LFUL007275 [Ladona fulva]|uniref:PNT domain-containing protein n=1 Tax=Ladona fulva TaxID=123851 RepID=A0A8K0K248_LADFU|nr:hypothetical protein J437_LFUL007275 [Ladona fulva]
MWNETQVTLWLSWATREFSLEGVSSITVLSGRELVAMGKETFLSMAPPFMGDILWEHLEILQREVERERDSLENVPPNLYEEAVCVPDLSDFLGGCAALMPPKAPRAAPAPDPQQPSTSAASMAMDASQAPSPQRNGASSQAPPPPPGSGAPSPDQARQQHQPPTPAPPQGTAAYMQEGGAQAALEPAANSTGSWSLEPLLSSDPFLFHYQ